MGCKIGIYKMEEREMKFSFIIPVYNCGQYLDKFIGEITDMALCNYEIILIDDGSTDNSEIICDGIAEKNEKIYCIHQSNQGVSAARNKGLKVASGDYICFFDADDNIDSKKLHALLKKIENSRTVIDIAVFGMSFDYYHKEKIYRRDLLQTPLRGILDKNEWRQGMTDLFSANSLSPIWNKVFRRIFLTENNLYLRSDMFLYEDLEYSLRCMAHSSNILFEPDIIYHYRQSEDEGNAGRRLKRIEHIYSVVDQIGAALEDVNERNTVFTIEGEMNNILTLLYLALAREKIAVSNAKQIRQICDDFSNWYHRHSIEIPAESRTYANLLLKSKIIRIFFKRKYTEIRHRIAVGVKNTGVYQRLKG